MSTQSTSCVLLITFLAFSSLEEAKGDLIINGDFESGNTAFASQLIYAPDGNQDAGQYIVTNDPNSWNGFFTSTPDHTSGTGNMLVVNGAIAAGLYVWQQSVSVSPNVDYEFSSWISTLYSPSPALLTVEINGVQLGPAFPAPSDTGTWANWTAGWNSGPAVTADIRIFNSNLNFIGNDFAVDDISFSASAVPEPSSFVLIGFVAIGLIAQRRLRS